ncbi:MAG TPA: ribosome small subunit-dependent GTPase A [Candidatus Anammoximicrobium sp.]|nr:ribosome small subunit-dependent GTPase A [Candidatus Anammoximicrobium sp.]
MANDKKRKIRAEFRKNRMPRARQGDLTRDYHDTGLEDDDSAQTERVSGKGELTRKRTVIGSEISDEDAGGLGLRLEVDERACCSGCVLSVHGLTSNVLGEDGQIYRCATRRLLKTLSTDQRHVVAAGDRVRFRPAGRDEGIIERIEPRHGVLSRAIRGRRQVIVANVDQVLIVTSAAQPVLKPHLIDRLLVTAEKDLVRPMVCINKVDLVELADLQPLVGVYGQMGYEVLLLSAQTGFGLERLKRRIVGRQSVFAGQSGVGKSSLLNAIEPGLDLQIAAVSPENEKGRHTTTVASLIPLSAGGYVVDTPGIRQFQLWDVVPQEVAGYFRDVRPYVSLCRFPDCTHTHEADCAVKDAVADGRLDARRYESYCQLFEGDLD